MSCKKCGGVAVSDCHLCPECFVEATPEEKEPEKMAKLYKLEDYRVQ